MSNFNFGEYLMQKGFSYTNEGKEQYYHKDGKKVELAVLPKTKAEADKFLKEFEK